MQTPDFAKRITTSPAFYHFAGLVVVVMTFLAGKDSVFAVLFWFLASICAELSEIRSAILRGRGAD